MNTPISILYPIINVLVTGLFAGVVLRQYLQRHRTYQLYWSIALLMAFCATLAYVLMIVVQPTSIAGTVLFRLYYILGAALMAAWLGLGSIALVASPQITYICRAILTTLSAITILLFSITSLDMQQLSHIAGTPGTNILLPANGPWLIAIIILNSLGLIAVVGVAIHSGWQLKRRKGTTGLLWANVLILVGASLNGLAGTTARLGVKNFFWLIMTLGWIVFFIGVLLASHPRRHAAPAKPPVTTEPRVKEAKV